MSAVRKIARSAPTEQPLFHHAQKSDPTIVDLMNVALMPSSYLDKLHTILQLAHQVFVLSVIPYLQTSHWVVVVMQHL